MSISAMTHAARRAPRFCERRACPRKNIVRHQNDMSNTTLSRWSPLRDLEEFQHRLLNSFTYPGSSRGDGDSSWRPSEWNPSVDISETDGEYIITAELPEVRKEDVKVMMENGILVLSGERRFEKGEKTRWHRIERAYGTFSRSFALPENSDPGQVSADFKNGMLRIRVGKSAAAMPRQIDVQVN